MWRQVPFTEIYVNEFGMVRYTDYQGVERTDPGYENKAGYRMIKVKTNRFYYVHRLVARCFIENECPEHFNVVHHKDQDKSNNSVHNLTWTTQQLNNSQKKNTRLLKKTRTGFKIQFIFDSKVHKKHKVYSDRDEALRHAAVFKQQLINAKRSYFISCSRAGKDPNRGHQCTSCGFIDNCPKICWTA